MPKGKKPRKPRRAPAAQPRHQPVADIPQNQPAEGIDVGDLLAAEPDRVADSGAVMQDIAAHMQDFLNRLEREVIPRLDSTDRDDRAVGAAHASCIAQEIEVQIERTQACEADIREALPGQFAVPDAFSEFTRSQEKELRSMADELAKISRFLLRDPSDPCHDLLDG